RLRHMSIVAASEPDRPTRFDSVGRVSSPAKVLVVGPPGVGKSWVARRLAAAHGLAHIELDGFKLKPGRQLATPEEMAASLDAAMTEKRWLLDGNWQDDEQATTAWN